MMTPHCYPVQVPTFYPTMVTTVVPSMVVTMTTSTICLPIAAEMDVLLERKKAAEENLRIAMQAVAEFDALIKKAKESGGGK